MNALHNSHVVEYARSLTASGYDNGHYEDGLGYVEFTYGNDFYERARQDREMYENGFVTDNSVCTPTK